MDLFNEQTDWGKALKPLIAKYKGAKHPLEYKDIYQLLVMVVLSAQDSDAHINKVAPKFFKEFPNMKALAKANIIQKYYELLSVTGQLSQSFNLSKI